MKQHHCGVFGEWVRDLASWQAFGTLTFEREVSVWGAWAKLREFRCSTDSVGEVLERSSEQHILPAMRRRTFLEVISAGAAGVLTGGFYEGRRMNYKVGREIQWITI